MRKRLPAEGKILVSACLAGRECAYDGSARTDPQILELVRQGRAVLVCPEDEGGLGTPRPASEIEEGSGPDVLNGRASVITKDGRDVTAQYLAGTRIALRRADADDCRVAVLKARSPACGCGQIYDGTFSKRLREGDGVTAAALKRAGVEIVTDEEL